MNVTLVAVVPAEVTAEILDVNVPVSLGLPEITPFDAFIDNPKGKFSALHFEELPYESVIVWLKFVLT